MDQETELTSRWCHRKALPLLDNRRLASRNRHLELRNTPGKKLRTDQVNMTRTASTFYQVVISLILKAIISTRKDSTSLEVTMIKWPVSTFQALSMRTFLCKRTKATTQETTEARTRRIDSDSSTIRCRRILNWEETSIMEVSMHTLELRIISMVVANNTPISSHKRGGTIKTPEPAEVDIRSTLSRTSSEGTLQMGQTWSTLQQRTRRWISAITMIKCLLAQRIHSKETATISQTKSHSNRINSLTRHIPKKNLLSKWTMHSQALRNRIKRNKTTVCWWQSCEMGGGRTETFDCS